MKVSIPRDWFTPNATRLKPGVHDVPDEWRGKLPNGAKIMGGGEKSPPLSIPPVDQDSEPVKRRGRPPKQEA